MSDAGTDRDLRAEIEQLLFREARLADESRYEEWLSLMTDDVRYWVPSGRADYDPDTRISFVNDNRKRLETRVGQLLTGLRYAQTPPSPMRRVISNLEIESVDDDGTITAGSNFVLHELAAQATNELRIWAGRATHRLRRVDGELRIAAKTVELVNASQPLPTLAFLL
ncbi:MAG: aromatic-ring-hydroxylating dioxygenase subunit beta [Ilumatobacteraceae bacterium]